MSEHSEETTPRRIVRRRRGRVIAGVAGGIADHTGLDVVLVRIAFVVLAALGGAGLVLYLLAWIAIPEEGEPNSVVGRAVHGRSRWLALGLIAIAVLILLRLFDQWGSPFTWAVALIAIGVVLLQEEPAEPRARVASKDPPPRSSAPAALESGHPVVRTRRPRSPLGTYTVGATLLAVALAVALSSSGAVDLDLGRYFALALLTLGCGLIVGGWWGRTRIVVVLGLLLVPLMLVGSVIDTPLRGHVGSRYIEPRRIDDSFEVLAGSLTLDYSRYRFEEGPAEVRVSFAAGNIDVYVPPGVEVLTRGSVSLGAVDLFGDAEEGRDLTVDGMHTRPGLTDGTLVLDVRGGIGTVTANWASWVEQKKRRQTRLDEKRRRVQNEVEEAEEEVDEQPARRRNEHR